MNKNALNFSAGPGALPEKVLKLIQRAIIELPETGMSVLGMSHRSDWFVNVVKETEDNIRRLLNLEDDFHVLFLQGGATQQFSMIPMTLLKGSGMKAEYLQTGYWGQKAVEQARKEGEVNVLWSGESSGYQRLPDNDELSFSEEAAYFHFVSNETVEGLQFHRMLGLDSVPRVCDMSSDFLSRPIESDRFSIIYAHAQKNFGPAGVTVVLIRDSVIKNAEKNTSLPAFLNYQNHISAHSNYNTPPVFAIYVVLLITRWLLEDVGGLENMEQINQKKARLLYQLLDDSNEFYLGRVRQEDRSQMNVAFNLADKNLEQKFLSQAKGVGFSGLEGHRSTGGVRASLYNGLPYTSVEVLADFMHSFRQSHR